MRIIVLALVLALALTLLMVGTVLASGPGYEGLGRCASTLPGPAGMVHVADAAHHHLDGGESGIVFGMVEVP